MRYYFMKAENISPSMIKLLLQKAIESLNNAYSLSDPPIRVGAALLGKSGKIYTGCNIENDVTNLGICAERVALFNAISRGENEFKAIAVVSDQNIIFPPCGACRQVLWQFISESSKDLVIIMGNKKTISDHHQIAKLSTLLPLPFTLSSNP